MQEDQNPDLRRASFGMEEGAFYTRLGVALTQWTDLEMTLCSLFARYLTGAAYETVAAAFYGPDHFHSRLQMTNSAATYALSGGALKEWQFLYQRIVRAAKFRNRIAHGQCVILPDAAAGRRFKLREPVGDPSSPDIADYNTGIHLKDLEEISARFRSVSAAMTCFLQRLEGKPETLRSLVLEDDYLRVEDRTGTGQTR